jgi:hypothetical protein
MAAAREGDHVGLARAPVGQRRGPLLRPARLVGVLAAEDHPAVDHARDDRRHLSGGHRHHRLVEHRESLWNASRLDQHVALDVQRQREQVRVGETARDRCRLAGDIAAHLIVALHLVAEDRRQS